MWGFFAVLGPLTAHASLLDGTVDAFLVPEFSTDPVALDGAAADLDGDGYAELVVGGWGRVHVYPGSPVGVVADAQVLDIGDLGFGGQIATPGDVNGDGYADLAVGAPYVSFGDIRLYFGSPTGLETDAPQVFSPGWGPSSPGSMLAAAGDVNGDGHADLLWGAGGTVVLSVGGPDGISDEYGTIFDWPDGGAANTSYGANDMVGGLDVNGDGYGDVVIVGTAAAPGDPTARVYPGGPAGPDLETFWAVFAERPDGGPFDAMAVTAVGDVDGDGFADFAVSNHAWHVVTLVHGGASGPSRSETLPALDGDCVLEDALGGGDVDGDGFSDLVLMSNCGDVVVYQGGGGPLEQPSLSLRVAEQGGFPLSSLTAAGDLNGDGAADVALAGLEMGATAAEVVVYHGIGPETDGDGRACGCGAPLRPSSWSALGLLAVYARRRRAARVATATGGAPAPLTTTTPAHRGRLRGGSA